MPHTAAVSTLSPLGFFVAPSALGPPSPLLADNVDPVTRDFRDLFEGANPVDDQVQVTIMTTLGSGGSVLQTGIRLNRRKMVADLQNSLEGDVRQALKPLVTNRDINFKRITFGTDPTQTGNPTGTVDEANQTAQINIEYRNLRALDSKVRALQLAPRTQIQVVS